MHVSMNWHLCQVGINIMQYSKEHFGARWVAGSEPATEPKSKIKHADWFTGNVTWCWIFNCIQLQVWWLTFITLPVTLLVRSTIYFSYFHIFHLFFLCPWSTSRQTLHTFWLLLERRNIFYMLLEGNNIHHIFETNSFMGVSATVMGCGGEGGQVWLERAVGKLVVHWTGKCCPLAETQWVALSAVELMWPLAH